MPVVIGAVGKWIEADPPRRPGVVFAVEEKKLHTRGIPGKYTEIDAAIAQRGSERRALAGDRSRAQRTGHGFTSQISAAYSAMVRSLENFPEPATLRIAVRAQAS